MKKMCNAFAFLAAGCVLACAATAMAQTADLTMAVTPAGVGTTVPAEGGPYTYNVNDVVNISATPTNPAYYFDHWEVSAGSDVNDDTAASTTVTMDQTKTVTAVFALVELTMAVSSDNPGVVATVPSVGGPYAYNLNDVVNISATPPLPGYAFHWTVSDGANVADPNALSTTVTMDRAKTVTAVYEQPTFFFDQFDTYSTGYLSSVSDPDGSGGPLSPVWSQDGCNDGRVSKNNVYSPPNAIDDYKNEIGRLAIRNRHDFTQAELQNAAIVNDPNPNAVNGTADNPLKLNFKLYLGPKPPNAYYYRVNRYVELTCGTERAPTPMLSMTCDGKTLHYLDRDLAGDGTIYRSIAVGQIALADDDPCSDAPDATYQSSYRLTVFDGKNWIELKTANIHTCANYNYVTLLIWNDRIDVKLSTLYNGTNCDGPRNELTTTINREYTGPFTSVAMGGLPNEESGGCWDQTNDDGYLTQSSSLDDIYLIGGASYYDENVCQPIGACCYEDVTGAMACVETTSGDCTDVYSGTYNGPMTTCDAVLCCHDPFADYDGDNDVDQVDFAAFQLCYTGLGGGVPAGCECFDHVPTGSVPSVDDDDYSAFEQCASGPGIPANPACD